MYRIDGPAEMKPVGEVEFVNGTAAMTASGQYGKSRLCAARVLEAEITAGDGRFRGIRHSVQRKEEILEPPLEIVAINDPGFQVSNPITQANASFKMRQSADPRDRIISELQERIRAVEVRSAADDDIGQQEPVRVISLEEALTIDAWNRSAKSSAAGRDSLNTSLRSPIHGVGPGTSPAGESDKKA